jgi:two-component system sensor histidine kinase RegB
MAEQWTMMSPASLRLPFQETSRLRLDTLIRLRWLAVAGQTIALLTVYWLLGFPLPLGPCFAAVAVSAWLNVILRLKYPATKRLSDGEALLYLGYDVAQLAVLLYLTGGLQNPFAFLFLVPVMVSAATLKPKLTLALGVSVLIVAGALAFVHWPLPWYPVESFSTPVLYVVGMWAALACSMMFMGLYAFRVAAEARQLSDALTATELILAREQHVSQLDGLAAAAAHELGTPLATIALIAKELERDLGRDPVHAEDIVLLREQIQRCRGILSKLTSMGESGDAHYDRMPLSHLIEEVVDPHRHFGIDIEVELNGDGPEPVGRRNPGILYGVGNIVENAVDFARTKVKIEAHWSARQVIIEILDDGPGFPPDIMDRLGEPYVTTRGRDTRRGVDGEYNVGLGLGFFIAKTLLERTGAVMRLENRTLPETGARVRITWPRAAMDTEREEQSRVHPTVLEPLHPYI